MKDYQARKKECFNRSKDIFVKKDKVLKANNNYYFLKKCSFKLNEEKIYMFVNSQTIDICCLKV
ncbi:hypothetical protein CAC63_04170 [Listeria monocytogenes]|nr:hypothetical protein [Listeria monocytogenes]EAG4154141.1 hypothetical protein [Listeria monocytogenes]RJD91031.1 hypothetical protein D3B08_03550 [Listeria monocytogenes]HAA2902592.1 hypothetical protein [Listeria monocytogenes]HAA9934715.1 hypothetical protein [Listeria monocytogenes]